MATTASMPESAPAPTTAPVAAPAAAPSRRPLIIGGVVLAVAVAAGAFWAHARRFEDTDDAQVDGSIGNVSPRVSGNVSAVYVIENQPVAEGQPLADIDPADLQIAVVEARAQVAQAQALLDAEDPNVPITQTTNKSAVSSAQSELAASAAGLGAAHKDVAQLSAQLAQAQATDRQAQLEKDRSEKLVATGAVSQADYDMRVNAAAGTAAAAQAIEQSLAAARDRVTQQQATIASAQSHLTEVTANAPRQVATRQATVIVRQAALDVARAQLAQAERNLGYAKIVAPITGIVAKKAMTVGDHVAPGQLVVAISQTEGLYVTANYREAQLEHMRPGQPATVHVDALGIDLRGSVQSLGGATGSRLSVLPPENASGNYVKVVQRIPVRIALDAGQPGLDLLRIGMSVEPKVTVR